MRIEDIDNLFHLEKRDWKVFLCTQNFPEHIFFRKVHNPSKVSFAIVIPTNWVGCVTHRNCSQLFYTCLQRNIGSCRGVEFQDG